jgi:hypothetical protein
VYVVAAVGEVAAIAAVETAIDEQGLLVALVEGRPLDRALREIELGHAIVAPIEELAAIVFVDVGSRIKHPSGSDRKPRPSAVK